MTLTYVVDKKEFGNQKELVEHIQAILHRYKPDEHLSKEDLSFIKDLLSYHPDSESKIGSGIKAITVGKNKHGTTCFYIIRKDDSKIDFSYPKCIKHYPASK